MVLVSVIATVGLMTAFSEFYNRFYAEKADNSSLAKFRRTLMLNYFSFHMIYVINIMTNQGNEQHP